jgi:hypothetical protein
MNGVLIALSLLTFIASLEQGKSISRPLFPFQFSLYLVAGEAGIKKRQYCKERFITEFSSWCA